MKTIFDQNDAAGIVARIEKLKPDTQRQWGKMNVAQMLAHTGISLDTAMGENRLEPANFVGRFIGSILKRGALSEKPFGKNSPTDKSYIFKDDRKFDQEKERTLAKVKKFSQGGPANTTKHPHPFFGHFTPDEWGVFQWKHLDHHLRQFGV
jgi:hypothetical protein